MEKRLAKLIVDDLGRQRAEDIRNASKLVDLLGQRKREGRVRILRSCSAQVEEMAR